MARIRLGERCYASAMLLLPKALRREFGADMLATFQTRAAETRRGWRYAVFVLREVAGVVVVAIAERFAATRTPRLVAAAVAHRQDLSVMEHVTRELRHALRRLRQTPAFTAAALFTLALAIGANVTIFTLVERIVLAPLPYRAQERLVSFDHGAPGVGVPTGLGMTLGLYREYAKLPDIEALALYDLTDGTVTGNAEPTRLRMLLATPSLSDVLGTRPALGRWFVHDEGGPGGANVVVLTHQFWSSRFGSDRAVVGRTLQIDGVTNEIIGVMPESFAFPDKRAQLILPQRVDLATAYPGGFNFQGVALVREGATIARLRAQFDEVIAQLPARFPEHVALATSIVGEAKLHALPVSLKSRVLNGVDQTLWVLLAAVVIVLLIACANLANLFLVRTDARQREVAVRRALGAGTGKVVGYFLSETLLISLASGAFGLLLASVALTVLGTQAPIALPRLHEVRLDAVAVGYTLLVALLAGFGFAGMQLLGRIPALGAVLQDSARGSTAGVRRMHGRQLLMAAQVSLAVVLLVGAGLMIQSFMRLQRADPGFRIDDALVFRIGLPERAYASHDAAFGFHEQLLERVRALPGVQTAAASTTLPLSGDGWGDPLDVRGAAQNANRLNPVVRFRRVSPSFFDALGVQLRRGRLLAPADMSDNVSVAVVNDALVQLYFAGSDPIGQQVRAFGQDGDAWFTIVGVVANTATYSMRDSEPVAKMYVPLRTGITAGMSSAHSASYVVRTTTGTPLALVPAIRRVIDELDANVAVAQPETLHDMVRRTSARTTFTTLLLVIASMVALVLGIVGVYAVISYLVTQRTGEIGVRLALGAQPSGVTDMIMRQSSRTIAAGVVVGLGAAAASARVLQSLLFDVAPRDVMTYSAVAIGLFVVALVACWLPARRAAQVSPLESLNYR